MVKRNYSRVKTQCILSFVLKELCRFTAFTFRTTTWSFQLVWNIYAFMFRTGFHTDPTMPPSEFPHRVGPSIIPRAFASVWSAALVTESIRVCQPRHQSRSDQIWLTWSRNLPVQTPSASEVVRLRQRAVWPIRIPVSYTHLTLPTIYSV